MEDVKKTVPAAAEGAAPAEAGADKDKGVEAAKAKAKSRRRKAVRQVSSGRAYVHASYNNTIVTVTDAAGNVLGWSSAGKVGFKGPKKATPYAASVIVKDLIDRIRDTGLKEVNVFVCGIGSGREASVRALHANGINVLAIKDLTPIPHNGCRAPKPRRI